ncbi:MAG: hypothetical protein GVY36_15795 [Verrucomicrobia bacterium]|nr:hypothetical protein [Verrucomicrobiota bacterium]
MEDLDTVTSALEVANIYYTAVRGESFGPDVVSQASTIHARSLDIAFANLLEDLGQVSPGISSEKKLEIVNALALSLVAFPASSTDIVDSRIQIERYGDGYLSVLAGYVAPDFWTLLFKGTEGDPFFEALQSGAFVDLQVLNFSGMEDPIFVNASNNSVEIEGGANTIAIENIAEIVGGSAADTLIGSTESTSISGGSGNDVILAGDVSSTLKGGTGQDM